MYLHHSRGKKKKKPTAFSMVEEQQMKQQLDGGTSDVISCFNNPLR
jgi:hypothetical protein